MSGTAYEVGIHLSAVNNVSGVLAVIGKELFGLQGSVKHLEESFSRLKMAFVGGLGAAAGMGMFHVMAKTVDQAKELSHELVQIQKLGLNDGQFAQVRRQMEIVPRNVPGVTQVDAGKAYGAMYSIFGHDDALKMMEPLSKFAVALGNTTGDFNGAFDKVYQMVRAGDLMGKFVDHETHKVDTSKLTNFLDLGARVTLGTHGKVGPDTWLALAQQGGPALAGMSDRGLATMGIVAQAMGGSRGGTAITSLYQQLIGGITTQRVAEQMKDMGIISGYTTLRGGHVRIGADQKNPEYLAAMKTDMVDFTKKLVEDMAKKGLNPEQMGDKLFELFGRQTTQRLMSDLVRNLPQIEGERGRLLGSMGIDASNDLANNKDLVQVEQNLKQAWKDLQETLGNSQLVIDMLNKLTAAIRGLNTFAQDHPEALKIIEAAAVGLATILTVLGTGAVVAAAAMLAPGAAIAAAVAGIAAAIGVLAALNWETVSAGFKQIEQAISEFIAWVGQIPGKILGMMKDAGGAASKWLKEHIPYDTDSKTPGLQQYTNPFKKSSFTPPSGGRDVHVHSTTAWNVDGETIARTTSHHIARLYEHPTSAAYHDGSRGFMPADGQFATV